MNVDPTRRLHLAWCYRCHRRWRTHHPARDIRWHVRHACPHPHGDSKRMVPPGTMSNLLYRIRGGLP